MYLCLPFCGVGSGCLYSSSSFIAFARYSIKNIGDRQSPRGTPVFVVKAFPHVLPHHTIKFTSSIKIFIMWSSSFCNIFSKSDISVFLLTVSNAFDMSTIQPCFEKRILVPLCFCLLDKLLAMVVFHLVFCLLFSLSYRWQVFFLAWIII